MCRGQKNYFENARKEPGRFAAHLDGRFLHQILAWWRGEPSRHHVHLVPHGNANHSSKQLIHRPSAVDGFRHVVLLAPRLPEALERDAVEALDRFPDLILCNKQESANRHAQYDGKFSSTRRTSFSTHPPNVSGIRQLSRRPGGNALS